MRHIHLFGASGSGTSTIGRALAAKYAFPYFDTDDFFWEKTEIPFETVRPEEKRIALLRDALQGRQNWILGGSLIDWGDVFLPDFTHVLFVYTQPEIRLARLAEREYERYGDRILEGGDMEKKSRDFLAWAAGYDTATDSASRNLGRHRAWQKKVPCPLLEVDGAQPLDATLQIIAQFLA